MINTVLYILLLATCIALIILILLQKNREGGMTALTGRQDSYWDKNAHRATEGRLILSTRIVAALAVCLTIALCIIH